MKNIIFINGTMGAGKTATSKKLQKLLPNCVFLDGDWCWDMHPFLVNEETKQMVTDNIVYLLNNFLHCSVFENIIFCWVMHEQVIMDSLLFKLDLSEVRVYKISLVCSEEALRKRIGRDIEQGIRTADVLERSIPRLRNYLSMDTVKIDVSEISAEIAAKQAAEMIQGE